MHISASSSRSLLFDVERLFESRKEFGGSQCGVISRFVNDFEADLHKVIVNISEFYVESGLFLLKKQVGFHWAF